MNKSLVFSFFGARFKAALLLVIYILCFDWMYKSWLSTKYDYLGFEYHSVGISIFIVSHIIAWLPVLIIPLKLSRPSILIYWFLFLMTYIPAVLLPVYIKLNSESDLYILLVSLLIGMIIIGSIYYFPVVKFKKINIESKSFILAVYILSALFIVYVLIIFKGKMQLVGLDEIYDLRFENDVLTNGNLVAYVILALGTCFFPLILAWGCVAKKYLMIFFGSAGQIFLYSTGGAKTYLFSSVIMVIIFFVIHKNKSAFGTKLLYFFILLIFILTFLICYGPDTWQLVVVTISSIVFMRTICMGGMLTAQYYYFFNTHPKTYYSHINIVGKIINYPYGNVPLGRVVGYAFTGNDLLNSNANFWATDGLAAYGIFGVILVSILCAILFWLLDSVACGHNVTITTLCIIVITMELLNTSIFTTILSGGFGLMILLLYLMPLKIQFE